MEFLNAFSHMDWTLVAHLTLQHITLVGIAVTLAIVVGVPLGIAMARSEAVALVVRPVLDLMQTMPAFVYLIPALILFGLGMVPSEIRSLYDSKNAVNHERQNVGY